jgi:EAL domain-containing protein (putative c-di-GMP-specific phosphodiesterase class I)
VDLPAGSDFKGYRDIVVQDLRIAAHKTRYGLDVLKIDKRFIDEIDQRPDARTIVDAIIAMSHALGLQVLAEGVETQSQLDILRDQGCHLFQGHLKSRPLDPDAITALLSTDGDRPLAVRGATRRRLAR